MDTPVRVVLVEDHPMFRVGLTATLGLAGDIAVVACAATAQEAGALVAEHRPDVVVLDIGLPDGTGIALIPRLRADSPASHILMLTSYDDDASIHAALRAGARGYVVKTADPDDIVRAVRTVATGAGHFSPTVVDRITTHVATGGRSSDDSTFPQLTRREREILALMAKGHGNTYIADYFVLSLKTIRNNVSTIMTKIGASSRADAVAKAHAAGLS